MPAEISGGSEARNSIRHTAVKANETAMSAISGSGE